MTNLELLDILGNVWGEYILQAQELRSGSKRRKQFRFVRQIAAILALILLMMAFARTAPGAAAVEYLKEKITSLIETLFPPQKMTILIEGTEYEGSYVADGIEPESTAEAPEPGFAIYYDADHYTMVKEENVTYIRPYQKPLTQEEILELYADSFANLTEEEQEIAALMNPQPDSSLPACEIEITHLDIPYEKAASQEYTELEAQWEIRESTDANRITFSMLSGHEWDSPTEVRDYISDEQGGCFRIISRYFLEAAEGHGVRFAAIVDSFAVIPPQESAG